MRLLCVVVSVASLGGAGCTNRTDVAIEGVITTGATATPLEGANVVLSHTSNDLLDVGLRGAVTDAMGRYVLQAANVPCRRLRLGVFATGTSMLLFGEAGSAANGFFEALGAERLLTAEGEFHGGYGWRNLAALVQRCSKPPATRVPN